MAVRPRGRAPKLGPAPWEGGEPGLDRGSTRWSRARDFFFDVYVFSLKSIKRKLSETSHPAFVTEKTALVPFVPRPLQAGCHLVLITYDAAQAWPVPSVHSHFPAA